MLAQHRQWQQPLAVWSTSGRPATVQRASDPPAASAAIVSLPASHRPLLRFLRPPNLISLPSPACPNRPKGTPRTPPVSGVQGSWSWSAIGGQTPAQVWIRCGPQEWRPADSDWPDSRLTPPRLHAPRLGSSQDQPNGCRTERTLCSDVHLGVSSTGPTRARNATLRRCHQAPARFSALVRIRPAIRQAIGAVSLPDQGAPKDRACFTKLDCQDARIITRHYTPGGSRSSPGLSYPPGGDASSFPAQHPPRPVGFNRRLFCVPLQQGTLKPTSQPAKRYRAGISPLAAAAATGQLHVPPAALRCRDPSVGSCQSGRMAWRRGMGNAQTHLAAAAASAAALACDCCAASRLATHVGMGGWPPLGCMCRGGSSSILKVTECWHCPYSAAARQRGFLE